METGAAINEARKMKNHFRVFERLEEVLSEVHAAKGVLSSLKSEMDRINSETVKVKSALKSKENALGAFLKLEIEKRRRSVKESLEVQTDLQENLNKQRAEFKEEATKKRKALDKNISTKQAELDGLNEQLEVARASLGKLQMAITKLQTQVGGLQPGM